MHLMLAAGWILWCALHSLLIAPSWMRRVGRMFDAHMAYYRLVYVAISIVTLIPVLFLQWTIDSPLLWSWPLLLRVLQWGGIAGALVIFVLASRQYDQPFFFGLRQIREQLDGKQAIYRGFVATGILRRMRHPYYSAGILLLLFWGNLTAANLIMKGIGIAYFILGAFLEERKLVAEFGDDYRRYQRDVPMFVPRLQWRGAK